MQEVQETWVRSLGQEDPLEEEMATHSSILARIIPWTEEPGRLQSGSDTTEVTEHTHVTHLIESSSRATNTVTSFTFQN